MFWHVFALQVGLVGSASHNKLVEGFVSRAHLVSGVEGNRLFNQNWKVAVNFEVAPFQINQFTLQSADPTFLRNFI